MKISGTLLTIVLCLYSMPANAEPPAGKRDAEAASNLEEILGRLEEKVSAMKTLKADFVQEKKLAVLDRPLVLKGTIFMQKPALLAWHVREPMRYSMVIRDETVRQWDEDTDQVQEVSLSKNPAFKMAIGQMRSWFSGEYKSMLAEYDVKIVGEDPTSLEFIPRETAFTREAIDSLTVVFEKDERYIQQIRIMEKRGDSTSLTFVDTLLDLPIDPSAWKAEQRVQ